MAQQLRSRKAKTLRPEDFERINIQTMPEDGIGIGVWIDFDKEQQREAVLCVRRAEQTGEGGYQPPTTRLFGSASAQGMAAGQMIALQDLRGCCEMDSRTTPKPQDS